MPRPEGPESAVTPREPALPQSSSGEERFSAGEQAHTVGLSDERAAQIVKQSSNARSLAFLGALFLVLFIPLYWLYDIGLPVVGVGGRLPAEQQLQQVTDISRGYALYLANCARCHDSPGLPAGNGMGNVGPPLNDQGKLYNALTPQGLPGNGHLNPDYINAVLREGGRYVCGDANSVMPAWLDPKGPLNYRQVSEIVAWITASSETEFVYQPALAEGATETAPPPTTVHGWRDPNYTPPPDATPVPACWRAPAATSGTSATPQPVASPGTAENPRVIEIEATDKITFIDPATGEQMSNLSVVQGETVEFHIINNSQIPHNFHIGSQADLSSAPEQNSLPGVDTFSQATETFTYTFDNVPDQPQFACTVPGHYSAGMNGDILVAASGGSEAPAASPSASPSAAP